jgi:hypothetical protein
MMVSQRIRLPQIVFNVTWYLSECDLRHPGYDGVISVDSAEARAHDEHKQSDDLL